MGRLGSFDAGETLKIYILCLLSCAQHNIPCALYLTRYTIDLLPVALYLTPYTLDPAPSTFHLSFICQSTLSTNQSSKPNQLNQPVKSVEFAGLEVVGDFLKKEK